MIPLADAVYTRSVRRWNEIEGQDRPKEILRRALERDRVHHGYLFVGPDGVGKYETALAYARIMNCEQRGEHEFVEACGTCPSCRKIANELQHPDLHVVLPQGNINKTIKIDQIRAIQKAAMTQPYEARYQLVIIDDVHLMTDEAANALLKTLEEPPATMRLFLVSNQPNALLDTILSRCQTIRFGALPLDVVVRILGELLEEPPSDEKLRVAAAFGEGSVGHARELVEAGLLAEREELYDDVISVRRNRPDRLLEVAQQLSKDRRALPVRLDLLKVLFRDAMLLSSGSGDRLVNSDMPDRVQRVVEQFDIDDVLLRIEAIRVAQDLLGRYVNTQVVMENLMTELAPGRSPNPIRLPKF